jgi:protein-arginine kinase activator protein McsA
MTKVNKCGKTHEKTAKNNKMTCFDCLSIFWQVYWDFVQLEQSSPG